MSYIKVTKTRGVVLTLNTIESAALQKFMGNTNYYIRKQAVTETGHDTWSVENDAVLFEVWCKLNAVIGEKSK